jgi:HSP20 family molecular chaperone IbpA
MSRMSLLNSPLLLGFDNIEQALERLSKTQTEGYPPYNIERLPCMDAEPARLRITLAVAGFSRDQLEVLTEDGKLSIRGKKTDDDAHTFLHRGIAARNFHRAFVLADGVEVVGATLDNGLLIIDLVRHEPERIVRKIDIVQK